MNFRDQKRRARRDLHETLQVPVLYLRSLASDHATAVPLTVRLWQAWGQIGDVKGSRIYPGEMQNEKDRIRFNMNEISRIETGAIVSVEPGEAYRVDNTLPLDDEFQTAEVTRLSAADAQDLPVPAPDEDFV
jgi:hypothetical protein